MDRIDKALFILPFLPLVDMVATLFSITLGGQEAGIIAKPIYEGYGELGLVAHSIILFLVFLVCVWLLRISKRKLMLTKILRQASKLERFVLVGSVFFFLLLEAVWIGAFVQNILVPLSTSPFELHVIWAIVAFAYLVSVSFLTRIEMKQFIRR